MCLWFQTEWLSRVDICAFERSHHFTRKHRFEFCRGLSVQNNLARMSVLGLFFTIVYNVHLSKDNRIRYRVISLGDSDIYRSLITIAEFKEGHKSYSKWWKRLLQTLPYFAEFKFLVPQRTLVSGLKICQMKGMNSANMHIPLIVDTQGVNNCSPRSIQI